MCLSAIHLGDPFKCFPLASFLVAEVEGLFLQEKGCSYKTGLFLLYLPARATLATQSKAVYPEKLVGQGGGITQTCVMLPKEGCLVRMWKVTVNVFSDGSTRWRTGRKRTPWFCYRRRKGMLPAAEVGYGGWGRGRGWGTGYEKHSATLEGILKRYCCLGPLGRRRRQVIIWSG